MSTVNNDMINEEARHRPCVGDVIRMPHYDIAGGPRLKRVWKIIGCHLGACNQEGTYELEPLDYEENKPIQIPTIMIERMLRFNLIERT